MALLALLLASALAGSSRAQEAKPPTAAAPSPDRVVFAFVGVGLISMEPAPEDERLLPDRTVVVVNGRITAVGPREEVDVPPEAVRIESAGRYLIPGLIDSHCHLLSDERIPDEFAKDELFVLLANGVTTIRDPIGRPELLALRDRIASGEQLGPRLVVGSPQFAGREIGDPFHGFLAVDPDEARAAVRRFAEEGYDAIKITFFVSRPVYDAIVAEAAAVGLPVIGHVGPDVGLDAALAAGEQIEHLDEFLEALLPEDAPVPQSVSGTKVWRPELWESLDWLDSSRIPALARRVVDAGVWSSPTLSFLNGSFGTGRSDDVLMTQLDGRFVSAKVRADLLSGRERFWADPPSAERRARFVELRNAITRELHAAGGRLMAGSDAPEWLNLGGFALHRELRALVDAGLEPWDALEAATRNPAEFFGGGDEYGTIAVGRRAELLLLRKNPLEDVANAAEIEGVMLDRNWFPAASLHHFLVRAQERLRQAPLLR